MERTEPMLPRIWRYTRSNGLGAVALVVALTMTPFPSHAGHLVVRTSDIVNGAVTAAKLRDGAVTTRKLRDGAVTEAKIREGAVTSDKLADRTVIASKLALPSVFTEHLSGGAVQAEQLASGAVTGPKIANGSVATPKLENGAVRASKLGPIVTRETEPIAIGNGSNVTATAFCATGEIVISGGARFTTVGSGPRAFIRSFRANPAAWTVTAQNNSGLNLSFIVGANCLRP